MWTLPSIDTPPDIIHTVYVWGWFGGRGRFGSPVSSQLPLFQIYLSLFSLSFSHFLLVFLLSMNMDSNSWNLRQLFGLIDQNQDGIIDVQDIVAVCTLPNAQVDQVRTYKKIIIIIKSLNFYI